MSRRLIIGGNWKMHKTPSEAVSTIKSLRVKLVNIVATEVVVCPPFVDLVPVAELLKETRIALGAQNLHWEDQGAFTGEVSADMLLDAGCRFVIVGHSERRHVFGETDEEINRKLQQALRKGLVPIFCVGELLEERRAGQTEEVVGRQVREGLKGLSLSDPQSVVIAYEPVWAIGTGENATPEQAQEVHRFIRRLLAELYSTELADALRIQYGGSVKPDNARDLMAQPDVDGALVGGASLDPDSFARIIKAAEEISN
jgi:triosephosphate isomerase